MQSFGTDSQTHYIINITFTKALEISRLLVHQESNSRHSLKKRKGEMGYIFEAISMGSFEDKQL